MKNIKMYLRTHGNKNVKYLVSEFLIAKVVRAHAFLENVRQWVESAKKIDVKCSITKITMWPYK